MDAESSQRKPAPGLVSALLKRFGRTLQARRARPRRSVLVGKIKHVEVARRTFALQRGGRHFSISWDDQTEFIGTAIPILHGVEVTVNARKNRVGLHAESIIAVKNGVT